MTSRDGMLGELADVCPSCHTALAKRPQRKTKCKACGAFIYSKRRPQDRAVVLCTEAQAAEIEEQWAIAQGLSSKPEHNAAQKTTARDAMNASPRTQDWSTYANGALELAKIGHREGDWPIVIDAISTWLYMCANGATNPGFQRDKISHFVAPGAVSYLADAAEALGYDNARIKLEFLRVADAVLVLIRGVGPDWHTDFIQALPPRTPEQSWAMVAAEL